MSSVVRNERLKLAAGALNTLGIALVITGVVAPTATAIYGGATRSGFGPWWLLIFAGWFLAGLVLHMLGQAVLGKLK